MIYFQDTNTSRVTKTRNNSVMSTTATTDRSSFTSEAGVYSREKSMISGKSIPSEKSSTSEKSITSEKAMASEKYFSKEEDTSFEAIQQNLPASLEGKSGVISQDEGKINVTNNDTSIKQLTRYERRGTFESLKSEYFWESWASFKVDQREQVKPTEEGASLTDPNVNGKSINLLSDDGIETGNDQIISLVNNKSIKPIPVSNIGDENIQNSINSTMNSAASSLETLPGKSAKSISMDESKNPL